MNPMPPIVCVTLLAAMMVASVSHYWFVENFVGNYPTTPAVRLIPDAPAAPTPLSPIQQQVATMQSAKLASVTNQSSDADSTEFFKELMQELRNLRNDNKALNNQIAETNRDVMKMQFQIDTHSESFRPMPTSDNRDDRSQMYDDDLPGVLPPRAEPVYPLDE